MLMNNPPVMWPECSGDTEVNIVAADYVVACVARASALTVLIMCDRRIIAFALRVPFAYLEITENVCLQRPLQL